MICEKLEEIKGKLELQYYYYSCFEVDNWLILCELLVKRQKMVFFILALQPNMWSNFLK